MLAVGSAMQDWYQMGIEARESALDAHGESLPCVAIAWQFVVANPQIFGDCEMWPKGFPVAIPAAFRDGYTMGATA